MRKHTSLLPLAALLLAAPLRLHAQYSRLDLPRESQHATVLQRIGITDITVDYSRPSVKGRAIWGEIVPYGEIWRAGANENTTLTVGHDITVEGQALKAGTYGVHMIPTKTTWTVIFNTDQHAWGSYFYDQKKDVLRVTVTPQAGPMTEQLTYDFTDVTGKGATLVLRWEKLEVPIKLGVDVHGTVMDGLSAQLKGLDAFTWEPWFEAAHYLHSEKMGTEKALKYLDRSIALKANFQNQTLKADILEEQGRTAEAEALRKEMVANASNAELNTYAYGLMNEGKKAEAVKMFELNAKRNPKDPNVFDSLGEGYMNNGQKDEAIKSFKKSLSMSPPDGVRANSIKCLKILGVDTSTYEKAKS